MNHGIVFRIYSSYGKGYSLSRAGDYRRVITRAAQSAITRYNPTVKAISGHLSLDLLFLPTTKLIVN